MLRAIIDLSQLRRELGIDLISNIEIRSSLNLSNVYFSICFFFFKKDDKHAFEAINLCCVEGIYSL